MNIYERELAKSEMAYKITEVAFACCLIAATAIVMTVAIKTLRSKTVSPTPLSVDLSCKAGACLSGGFSPGAKPVKTITVRGPVSGVL